ncbi:MAG: O-antigen ligase family protein [Chitinispirillaceae bacterium]|nr:O-antigen ligase family protein [Chitinispirillaceae bacterium]
MLGVILIIFNPESTLIPLFLTSFYIGFPVYQKSMFSIEPQDIVAIFLFAAFYSRLFKKEKFTYEDNTFVSKIVIAFFVFFIFSLFSLLINLPHKKLSQGIISCWYLTNLIQLIVFFLIFSEKEMSNLREKLINLVFVFSIIECVLAFVQYLGLWKDEMDNLRYVKGTFTSHHVMLGNMMSFPLVFSIYRINSKNSTIKNILYICAIILFLYVIIISGSRSVLAGLFVAFSIWILTNIRISFSRFIYFSIFSVILLFVLWKYTPLKVIIINTIRNNYTKSLDFSSYFRIVIWQGVIEYFKTAPLINKLFGIGIGNFYMLDFSHLWLGGVKNALGGHNNFLHALAETGVLGLISFLSLFITILYSLWKKSKEDKLSFLYFWLTIAFLFSGIFQETFWFQPAFSRLWLFYTIFLCQCLNFKTQERK